MKKPRNRRPRFAAPAAMPLAICVFSAVLAAESHASRIDQSAALLRWAEAEISVAIAHAPGGTALPPPSPAAISGALDLFSTSPLTGQGARRPNAGPDHSALGSAVASSMAQPERGPQVQLGSPPPITVQLPPPPPERYAPSARGLPPIQIPDPETIPSPPATQAPPARWQPPIEIPRPAAGGAPARPPIQIPDASAIPLPPPPPEEQAPWLQGG